MTRIVDGGSTDEWEVTVFAEDQVNAFALPGGPVWLHRGVLQGDVAFVDLFGDEELYVSTLSENVRILPFEAAFDLDPGITWTAQYDVLAGVDDDVDLTIDPGRWKALNARVALPDDLHDPEHVVYQALWVFAGQSTLGSLSRPNADRSITGETAIQAWMTAEVESGSGTGVIVDIGDETGSAGQQCVDDAEVVRAQR